MSKVIPTDIELSPLGRIVSLKKVFASDWQKLNESLNFHFGATGAHVGGMVFRPAWTQTTTSYTTSNIAADPPGDDYDLDDWQGLYRPTRQSYSSGDRYLLSVDAYIANLTLRVTYVRLTTNQSGTPPQTDTTAVSTSTLELTNSSSTAEWVNDSFVLASSNDDWALIYVEAKVPVSGTGYLHQFAIRERFLANGDETYLPRGS